MDLGNVFGIDSCAENSLGNSKNGYCLKCSKKSESFINLD